MAAHEIVRDWPGGKLQVVGYEWEVAGTGPPTVAERRREGRIEAFPVGDGLALPVGPMCLEETAVMPGVWLDFGYRGGVLACIGVRSDENGPPITQALVRKILFEERARVMAGGAALRVWRRLPKGRPFGVPLSCSFTPDDLGSTMAGMKSVGGLALQPPETFELARNRRGRKRLDDEFLRAVADEYRAALLANESAAIRIAGRFHGGLSSARRWVYLARKRGFLGEAPAPRRRGEVQERGLRERAAPR